MSRRSKPSKRIPKPDAVYGDVQVSKFINRMMLRGKKSVAEGIFYRALVLLEGKTDQKPVELFFSALKRVRPLVRVKARRVGGSTYQVPIEVREDEGVAIGSRWLITYARKRNGRTMAEKLAAEVLDASKGVGGAAKKREETHKMAESNKAFSHYRY
jgi:small subunit ribosomal protein S7